MKTSSAPEPLRLPTQAIQQQRSDANGRLNASSVDMASPSESACVSSSSRRGSEARSVSTTSGFCDTQVQGIVLQSPAVGSACFRPGIASGAFLSPFAIVVPRCSEMFRACQRCVGFDWGRRVIQGQRIWNMFLANPFEKDWKTNEIERSSNMFTGLSLKV